MEAQHPIAAYQLSPTFSCQGLAAMTLDAPHCRIAMSTAESGKLLGYDAYADTFSCLTWWPGTVFKVQAKTLQAAQGWGDLVRTRYGNA